MPWGNDEESILEKFLKDIENSHPMTVRCAWCPQWTATGTTEETRKAQEEHMRDEHPDKARAKKKPGKRRSKWSSAMSAAREEEIDNERVKRMFVLGIKKEGEDAEPT